MNTKSKFYSIPINILLFWLILFSNKTFSQEINSMSVDTEAKIGSLLSENPSFLLFFGQDIYQLPEQEKTKLLSTKISQIKSKMESFGFTNVRVYSTYYKELKRGGSVIAYINGELYGRVGGVKNSASGIKRLCDLFYNNPKGTTNPNGRFHLSENYIEEYSNEKSNYTDNAIPDSKDYFLMFLKNLSLRGIVMTISYSKERDDYVSVVNEYKKLIKNFHQKTNNVGLVIIDQNSFPNSSIELLKYAKKDIKKFDNTELNLQIWYNKQLLLDYQKHSHSKILQLKKVLSILTNVSPNYIEDYTWSLRELGKFQVLGILGTDEFDEYLEKSPSKEFFMAYNKFYTSQMRIKAELIRNLGELKILLNQNDGMIKKQLNLELFDIKIE